MKSKVFTLESNSKAKDDTMDSIFEQANILCNGRADFNFSSVAHNESDSLFYIEAGNHRGTGEIHSILSYLPKGDLQRDINLDLLGKRAMLYYAYSTGANISDLDLTDEYASTISSLIVNYDDNGDTTSVLIQQ